jgi:hypothetical protein
MEGLNKDVGPSFEYTFSCEFMKYDPNSRSFHQQGYDKLVDLFDEDPVAILSDHAGSALAMHEIRISYKEPATATFVYPAVGDSEVEVVFRWNGTGFVKE